MFASQLRCCGPMKHINGVLGIGNSSIGNVVAGIGRSYTDKGKCCKDIAQTKGKAVEPWPKSDPPPPAWRCECPYEPQPPNYDPYRIKVPDVVVPPLPPSNAKWTVLASGYRGQESGYPHQQPPQQQYGQYGQYGYPQQQQSQEKAESKEQGLMGLLRGIFDKIRGKDKGGSDALIAGNRYTL